MMTALSEVKRSKMPNPIFNSYIAFVASLFCLSLISCCRCCDPCKHGHGGIKSKRVYASKSECRSHSHSIPYMYTEPSIAQSSQTPSENQRHSTPPRPEVNKRNQDGTATLMSPTPGPPNSGASIFTAPSYSAAPGVRTSTMSWKNIRPCPSGDPTN